MLRRKAREYALKILYMMDIKKERNSSILETFWENIEEKEEVKKFANEIVTGVIENLENIDKVISTVSLNWDIERMGYIDRNILRIGTYEILYRDDIPPVVSINEGIELSKIYGDEDSPKFVNGILHKVKEIHEKKGGKNES
ncbi:MAG: transcription antitermination factor NusB [Candidatus Omnitrophica bacterium]|nr:transcription antitermination factor NusB [Candidatus Omnitrophota bacterium]MCM8806703.1 transcription antitermination factor NusB [Candidatus Omnitrophota bacterium]